MLKVICILIYTYYYDIQISSFFVPALFLRFFVFSASKKKKKKKATPSSSSSNEVKTITDSLSKTKLDWPGKDAGSSKKPIQAPDLTGAGTDPAKKLKNLKKKLRDIEALELKIKSGEVKPDKDQVEKINRKDALVEQIAELEAEEGS
jgi:partner of Y14 and mago